MNEPLVRMENISKSFGRVQALQNVDFTVGHREIVGLVGDNGAGKSTLIKVLAGAIRATHGEIFFKGEKVNIRNTRDAIKLGIETIYQDSALVPQLSIARNLFLGREPTRRFFFINRLAKKHMNNEARALLNRVGIMKNIDPRTPITALSGGERQAIAISRAMYFEADLIIMDEPTNHLGVEETQGVLRFIKEAKEAGHSSIFITHNIYHVFQVVDRIVVMRLGKKVADIRPQDTTIDEVEKVITGMQSTIQASV
jgi:simple sugar transport system ATP-binding protein